VQSYQHHQGDKLRQRFNAYSYYRLSQVVDSHNVGRNRGSIAEALRSIKARTQVVAISSDILFPPTDHQPFIDNIPNVRYTLINSEFGHDGFLVEHEYLTRIVKDFLS
jgi:homoserine O-acetyltransferase